MGAVVVVAVTQTKQNKTKQNKLPKKSMKKFEWGKWYDILVMA
jgi:hypothetical protein